MFKRSIYFAIGYVIATLAVYATSIHSINKIEDLTHQVALNGRAVFEAYPECTINSWKQLDAQESLGDQAYMQNYPPILSRDELLKLHREIEYKEHRFFDVLGLSYMKYPKTQKLIQLLINKARAPIYYLKEFYQRPRPFNIICGGYMPIDKPKTFGYPSAGSTEAMLVALFLQEIFEDSSLKYSIMKLGIDMGYRRQLAGVAFPSDIKSGRELAKNLKRILSEDKDVIRAFQASKQEMSGIFNISPKADDVFSFSETGTVLVFEKTRLKDFLSQIQLLTKKRITIDGDPNIIINEQFPSNEWPAYLDIIAWEHGLNISEDDNTIIITKSNKEHEK